MTLNQEQKDLLVGTLLGDGNLQTATKGRTWRYRTLHKFEHKDYLLHKYEVLKNFCSDDHEPVYDEIFVDRTQQTYKRMYFNTKVADDFRHYGNLFYTLENQSQTMIKDVPKNIKQLLTPRAVAYWYMDDGSIKELGRGNAMRICTESFSLEGVQRLKNALKELYNVEHTSLNKKTNNQKVVGYRLAIREKSASDFRNLIEPYLVPCMKYKVSDGFKGHL